MKYLYFILLICTSAFAQEIDIAKDTIKMRALVIEEDLSTFKDAKIKIKGECMNPESLNTYTEIVTLADKLPQGYLESVSLYFNQRHYMSYSSDSKYFEDTEFEVVLYKVNDDNTPGERIMKDEKYIKVMKDHTGKAEIHFLEFNIKNEKRMFIGLRRTLPGNTSNREFYIDCVCNSQNYITYTRSEKDPQWSREANNCPALKMEVNFLVPHE